MLKLNDPVRYTDAENAHIEANLKPKGKNGWSDSAPETIAIKHHISKHTIIAQGGRCAYCEKVLAKGDVDIEHIAPKKHYGAFMFEPYNLLSSCTCCNAPVNKGQNKTIVEPANLVAYDANQFTIVHSYFDNPDDHIKYMDEERTMIDINNCTVKGKETINMLHWNEWWAIYKRLEITGMRHFRIDVLKLAAEISTYKVK